MSGIRAGRALTEAAVQRQIERANLAELIATNEEIHGPLNQTEIRAAREEIYSVAVQRVSNTPAPS